MFVQGYFCAIFQFTSTPRGNLQLQQREQWLPPPVGGTLPSLRVSALLTDRPASESPRKHPIIPKLYLKLTPSGLETIHAMHKATSINILCRISKSLTSFVCNAYLFLCLKCAQDIRMTKGFMHRLTAKRSHGIISSPSAEVRIRQCLTNHSISITN